jgi:hypothetical protein
VTIGRRLLLVLVTVGVSVFLATSSVAASNEAAVPWASLGVVRPSLVQSSGGGSPIAAQPTDSSVGWCSTKGVEVASDGSHAALVSDTAVGLMLKRSHMEIHPFPGDSGLRAICEDVALDPNHPQTVYAAFEASQDGSSIPPIYDVVLVTSNEGSPRLVEIR